MDTLTLDLDARIDLNILDNIVADAGVQLTYMEESFQYIIIDVAGEEEDLDYFEKMVLKYEAEVIEEEESHD